jgi:hypothetical protein
VRRDNQNSSLKNTFNDCWTIGHLLRSGLDMQTSSLHWSND